MMWSEVSIHQGDKTPAPKELPHWRISERNAGLLSITLLIVYSIFAGISTIYPAQQHWHNVLRRHRIFCNVLSPLVLRLSIHPLLQSHPIPWVFFFVRNFALQRKRSIQISGNCSLCARAAFLSLPLTHKHSQVQLSPWQGTEPEKQSHRHRHQINICPTSTTGTKGATKKCCIKLGLFKSKRSHKMDPQMPPKTGKMGSFHVW